MESAPDLLHLFVQALALFATSLDRWFHVPWPLSITLLFIPVVAILDMVVWYFRGRAFPILCNYPTTKRGYCTRMVVGEWHRCLRDHSWRWRRKTDHHEVMLRPGKTVSNGPAPSCPGPAGRTRRRCLHGFDHGLGYSIRNRATSTTSSRLGPSQYSRWRTFGVSRLLTDTARAD
jgi:hypothetical protein